MIMAELSLLVPVGSVNTINLSTWVTNINEWHASSHTTTIRDHAVRMGNYDLFEYGSLQARERIM
jgi:hypothetical protein